MTTDDFEALRPRNLTADLTSWNLENLTDYISALRKEIARVEDKIAEKEKVGNEAASLFKS